VTVIGKNILGIATLFTSVLFAGISLFHCRELINIFKHVFCLRTLNEELFVFHRPSAVIKLLLLGCVPFYIVYILFCPTLDNPLFGFFLMTLLFPAFSWWLPICLSYSAIQACIFVYKRMFRRHPHKSVTPKAR